MSKIPPSFANADIVIPALVNALAFSHGAEEEGERVEIDMNASLAALAFTAAMLLEGVPTNVTPRDLRLAAEAFGDDVHSFMKAMREDRETTGVGAFEKLGGKVQADRAN